MEERKVTNEELAAALKKRDDDLIAQARAAERAAIVADGRAFSEAKTEMGSAFSTAHLDNFLKRIESGAHLASGASGEEKKL